METEESQIILILQSYTRVCLHFFVNFEHSIIFLVFKKLVGRPTKRLPECSNVTLAEFRNPTKYYWLVIIYEKDKKNLALVYLLRNKIRKSTRNIQNNY
jgi:hypothetical protein